MSDPSATPSGNISSAVSSALPGLRDTAWSGLQNLVVETLKGFMYLEKNADDLTRYMEELRSMRVEVEKEVQKEEKRPKMERTSDVVRWWKNVDSLDAKVTAFQKQVNPSASCYFEPVCTGCALAKEAVELLWEVRWLIEKGKNLEPVHAVSPDVVEAVPRKEKEIFGGEKELGEIRDHIGSERVRIVRICGMGGVGKTTLLCKIYRDFLYKEISHDFNLIIWVEVSNNLNVFKIQEEISVQLGYAREGEGQLSTNEIDRRNTLYCALQSKKFLLLLDDVWKGLTEEVVLDKIGIPLANTQSKILFTTRLTDVCTDMNVDAEVKVTSLNSKNSWNLFSLHVGNKVDPKNPSYRPFARKIIEGCGGLPLALIIVGKSMTGATKVKDWKDACKTFEKIPDQVLNKLRFSFDRLESESLRQAFLYCVLLPKDKDIEEKQLIEYWIGEGQDFLQSDSINRARQKGREIIKSLKSVCLLDSGGIGYEDSHVRMHDMVRQMALYLTSVEDDKKNVFLVDTGNNQSSLTPQQKQKDMDAKGILEEWEVAKRISLVNNKNVTLPSDPPQCKKLLTLLMKGTNTNQSILHDMFALLMPNLQVLDLSDTNIQELPKDIGVLTKLQYLNLSSTKIKTLPIELGNLTQLRVLNLWGANQLQTIPNDAILKLESLQILNINRTRCHVIWEPRENIDRDSSDSKLNLWDLERSLKKLEELDIGIGHHLTTLEGLVTSERLYKCLNLLELREVSGLTSEHLSQAFKRLENLRDLNIIGCLDLKELKFVNNPQLDESLESLYLHGLSIGIVVERLANADLLPLHCLVELTIQDCGGFTDLTWVGQLPSLLKIFLSTCSSLEKLLADVREESDDKEGYSFPSLTWMRLKELPNLSSISGTILPPSLQILEVTGCPGLKKLPLGEDNTKMLSKISGENKWWNDLDWGDENKLQSTFLPYFRPIDKKVPDGLIGNTTV